MSSEDSQDISDEGSSDALDATEADAAEADETEADVTGIDGTGADGTGADQTESDQTESDTGAAAAESSNTERRAARAARREESADRQLTLSVRTLKRIGVVVVAAAAVAAIAVSLLQVSKKNDELAAFSDSKAAAGHFITTYFESMGGPNASPASLRKAVEPLSTGDFKKRLGSDAVMTTEFMKQINAQNMKTTVTSSMVESFDTDRATVVLGVDVTGTSSISEGGGRNAILLQLELEKVDGNWLVSKVDAGPGVTVAAQQGQAPESTPPTEQAPPTP